MTPQANFMILAPIDPACEAELRQLLDSINAAPGRVNPHNPLIPFAQFDMLHFGRFVILDDKTLNDVRVYGGGPAPTYPLYLAFLGDIDGYVDTFFEELMTHAEKGLRSIFSCCEGFIANTDLVRWMKTHSAPAIAAYVNWRGRTVRQVQEEAALKEALENYLKANEGSLVNMSGQRIRATLRECVIMEELAGHLTLSAESPTPVGWWFENLLHLIVMPLLLLVAFPLLIIITPVLLIRLPHFQTPDPELSRRLHPKSSDYL